MGFIEDLRKTKEGRKTFERERVLFEASEHIATAMEEEGLKKCDLAKLLGTHKSYITQLLNGTENMTLAKVSDVLFELDRHFSIHVCRVDADFEEIEIYPAAENWAEPSLKWKPSAPLVAETAEAA